MSDNVVPLFPHKKQQGQPKFAKAARLAARIHGLAFRCQKGKIPDPDKLASELLVIAFQINRLKRTDSTEYKLFLSRLAQMEEK